MYKRQLIKCLPETNKDISKLTGVSVRTIDNFLKSKEQISSVDLERLFDYFCCSYSLQETFEGNEFNDFRLEGGYTTFPKGKQQVIKLYETVSNGGDLEFAYHLVYQGGYSPDHTRFLLLNTCYSVYNLIVIKDQGKLVDELIEGNKLINFSGDRVACEELFREIDNHIYNILSRPADRRTLDKQFFSHKELVFAQLGPSVLSNN